MTPDQVAVAVLIEEVDRDAVTVRFLLQEAHTSVAQSVESILEELVRASWAAEAEHPRFRLNDQGRRTLWDAKGWQWGGPPSWQQEKQLQVRAVINASERVGSEKHSSPSGRYTLEVIEYETGDGRWNVTAGVARRAGDAEILATVQRNYGIFPFSWCEDHPVGHDYLLCGADYQGQTVIELDTGGRVDHLPDSARSGGGFCWATHYPTADRQQLVVDGCYWACPYELVVYDFRQPMELPYTELHRWPSGPIEGDGFQPDGSLVWTYEATVRKSDGKALDELTDEDTDLLVDDKGHFVEDLLDEVKIRAVWRPGAELSTTVVRPH